MKPTTPPVAAMPGWTQPKRPLLLAVVAVATLLFLLMVTSVGSAQAAAYRYWSYWQGASGQWVSAQTGPGEHLVTDADVQGWRFAITATAPMAPPDNPADFATLCPSLASTSAAPETVRVAVVIDSGLAADAPKGQAPPADRIACLTLPAGATGNQALAAAAIVNSKNSLICAINGYPAGECAAEVSDAVAAAAAEAGATERPNPASPAVDPASSAESDSDAASGQSDPLGTPALVAGLAAVVAVAGAAVFVARRRTR